MASSHPPRSIRTEANVIPTALFHAKRNGHQFLDDARRLR
jgi:hypothetical protein